MLSLFISTLLAIPSNLFPALSLSCQYTNLQTKESGSFTIDPKGSWFRDTSVIKSGLSFTFKMLGSTIYTLRTQVDNNEKNFHSMQYDKVGWTLKYGYYLKEKKIDVNNAQVNLRCDQIINNRW